MEHLFVSDITFESFRLAWTAEDDIFDRFVIKVRDSKKLAHPKEVSVSGQERTKVLTGLAGGTEYEIELYGVTLERRSQPITGVARTGIFLGLENGSEEKGTAVESSYCFISLPLNFLKIHSGFAWFVLACLKISCMCVSKVILLSIHNKLRVHIFSIVISHPEVTACH